MGMDKKFGSSKDKYTALQHVAITVFSSLLRFYGPVWDKFRIPYVTSLLVQADIRPHSPLIDFKDQQLMRAWRSLQSQARHHAILCIVDTYQGMWCDARSRRHHESSLYDSEAFLEGGDPLAIPFPSQSFYWRDATSPPVTVKPNQSKSAEKSHAFPYDKAPLRAFPFFKLTDTDDGFYLLGVLDFTHRYKFLMAVHQMFLRAKAADSRLPVRAFIENLSTGRISAQFDDARYMALFNEATTGQFAFLCC